MRIVLGVSGGIAAYKTAHLLRLLREDGHRVDVVPTPAALEFVGRATWEALSGRPVTTSVFEGVEEVRHVRLGQQADLLVVAPATADLLARVRGGMADDLLTSTLLATEAPTLLVPAMHTEMWQNPATAENISVLRERGLQVMEPAVGRLTGRDSGPGRMPEPEDIRARLDELAERNGSVATTHHGRPIGGPRGPLSGRRVVVTAGGTREPLDPVRYLGNRSSGKQGLALAEAALTAGAEVTLITGVVDRPPGPELSTAQIIPVETAAELQETVLRESERADLLIMAAAVADFRPAEYSTAKIKKSTPEPLGSQDPEGSAAHAAEDEDEAPVIRLERNPDILADTVRRRAQTRVGPEVIVGFAAETGDEQHDPLDLAAQKLRRKGCELLVLNLVGEGLVFGQDETEVHVLASVRAQQRLGQQEPATVRGTKAQAAQLVVEQAARLFDGG